MTSTLINLHENFLPLWWNHKFQHLPIRPSFNIYLDVQLTTHQPPMPNSSQTSAWSHRYIGRGNGKTEIPLLDSERISED